MKKLSCLAVALSVFFSMGASVFAADGLAWKTDAGMTSVVTTVDDGELYAGTGGKTKLVKVGSGYTTSHTHTVTSKGKKVQLKVTCQHTNYDSYYKHPHKTKYAYNGREHHWTITQYVKKNGSWVKNKSKSGIVYKKRYATNPAEYSLAISDDRLCARNKMNKL